MAAEESLVKDNMKLPGIEEGSVWAAAKQKRTDSFITSQMKYSRILVLLLTSHWEKGERYLAPGIAKVLTLQRGGQAGLGP